MKVSGPKVSVCMPSFNRKEYTIKAIESVLTQSFQDFELVITDDRSDKDTVDAIKQYMVKDSRIRFFVNDRQLGVYGNLNMSIMHSRGEYIKPICNDDMLAPRCLEVFTEVMDKNPNVSLVTSFTKAFDGSELIRDEKYFEGIRLLDGKWCQKSLLFDGNWVGALTYAMFRRRDLYVGLFTRWKYWVGDHEMWIKLLGTGDLYVVPEILSFIRVHDNRESAVHGVEFRLITERLMLMNLAFDFPHIYGEYSREEKRAIRYHLLKRLVREGYSKGGLQSKFKMLKIGFSDLNKRKIVFLLLLVKNFYRLFRESTAA